MKQQPEHMKFFIGLLESWKETFQDEAINDEGEDENIAGWKNVRHCISVLKKSNTEQCDVYFHIWQALHKYVGEYNLLAEDLGDYDKNRIPKDYYRIWSYNDNGKEKYFVDTDGASNECDSLEEAQKLLCKYLQVNGRYGNNETK